MHKKPLQTIDNPARGEKSTIILFFSSIFAYPFGSNLTHTPIPEQKKKVYNPFRRHENFQMEQKNVSSTCGKGSQLSHIEE